MNTTTKQRGAGFQNFLLSIFALTLVSVGGINLYKTIIEIGVEGARFDARIACSSKIPDEPNSVNWGFRYGNTNYTNYPAFDRCMAGRGF